jgi:hypothetical protein
MTMTSSGSEGQFTSVIGDRLPGGYQKHPKAKVESSILISRLVVKCLRIHHHSSHEDHHLHPATRQKELSKRIAQRPLK